MNTYRVHIYISPQRDKFEFSDGKRILFYDPGTFKMFFDIHLLHITKQQYISISLNIHQKKHTKGIHVTKRRDSKLETARLKNLQSGSFLFSLTCR